MHYLDWASADHTALPHWAAGALLAFALLWFIREFTRPSPSTDSKQSHTREPITTADFEPPGVEQSLTPPLRAPTLTPLAEPEIASHDRDSAPDVARVFLLCQNDAEADEPTHPDVRLSIGASGDSDAGKKRARNEDSFLLSPSHSLVVVADGMGGHRGGKEASFLAVQAVLRAFDESAFDDEFQCDVALPRRGRELAAAVVKANEGVFGAAQVDPELFGMGTTLVAARFSLDEQRVYIAHVGDSRCYRLRGSKLTQLTTDHTMRHLGLQGPHANDLSRALGIDQTVQIDLVVDAPRAEDIYLLCSDGLPKMVSDRQIELALQEENDLESAVYRLIELANDAGGVDNVTVVLARVREPRPPAFANAGGAAHAKPGDAPAPSLITRQVPGDGSQ